MSKQSDIVTGLQIFMAHGGSCVDTIAEVLYAQQEDREALTQAEVDELRLCGWFHPSRSGACDCCYPDNPGNAPLHRDAVADDTGIHHLLTCTSWAIFA